MDTILRGAVLRYRPVAGAGDAGVDAAVSALIGGRDRFWLFLSRTFHHDPQGRVPASCDRRYRRDLQFTRGNVTLIRYIAPTGG